MLWASSQPFIINFGFFNLTIFETNNLVVLEKEGWGIPNCGALCLHFGDEFLKGGL